ncbi:MAG: hypothetical protein JWQ57_4073 [Mucilaginibacter sp.]|nr:hypothetical protein [Mucilaginibacter sp.]
MIMIKLSGRLGNQIFQYAFAVAASKNLNTCYFIDDSDVVNYVALYFKKLSFTDNKIIRKSFLKLNIKPSKIINQTGYEKNELILQQITDNCFYSGYFQSTVYFENIERYLIDKITIKKEYQDLFKSKFPIVHKKILAIHFRLKDYLEWGNDELGGVNLTLPDSYYYNALDQIPNIEDYTIIVVTDDSKSVQTRIPAIKNKIVFSESEILDFQLLLNADILIISNSSFAWWAAYLNPNNPKIFAPKYWLGFKVNKEFPSGIISEKFIPIDVY